MIPGGGVGDAEIDGEVNIFVIDEDTDEPIQGADVTVGLDITGTTDADGLLVVKDVSDAQDITVVAADYTSATWYGVNGANVTIPLSLADPPAPNVPQATVTGTIAGWDAMEPPTGQLLLAFVGYSSTNVDEDPANEIVQPTGDLNQCAKQTGGTEPCAWSLVTREGPQIVYAFIAHADITVQPIEIAIVGFAHASLDVEDGVDQDGITLDVAAASDLETADVGLPSAPAGTEQVAALARYNLGDEGRLQLPVSGLPAADVEFVSFTVPKLELFADATLDLVGFAGNDPETDAQAIRIDRGVTTLDGASVGAFLELPQGLSTDGQTYSFDAVADASIHVIAVHDLDDVDAWGAVILDGRTEVVIPAAVELPQGSLTFVGQGLEIPDLDVQDFSIDAVTEQVTRISAGGVSFSN